MKDRSHERWRTTRRPSILPYAGLFLVLVALVSSGCFSHFGLPWKAKAGDSDSTQSDKTESDGAPSDKPNSDPGREEAKAAESGAASVGTPPESADKGGPVPPENKPGESPSQPATPTPVPSDQPAFAAIDAHVRKAALEKAAGLSAVEYMKICHAKDRDEWWVILYDNIGLFVDVKQHVWNKQTAKLERVLALKQIMHSKLETNLRKNGSGRTCKVFFRPRGESSLFAWKLVDPSSARMIAKSESRMEVAALPSPAPTVPKRSEEKEKRLVADRQPTAGPEKQLSGKQDGTGRHTANRSAPVIQRESAPSAGTSPSRIREPRQSPNAVQENSRSRSRDEERPDKSVLTFLQNWKAAWEEKDFDRFKRLYHPDFRADSLDFTQFLNRKNDFFHRYRYIRVEIDGIKMKRSGNSLEVTFLQDFRGDNYADKGVKHMVLDVSRPKTVRILSETWSPR